MKQRWISLLVALCLVALGVVAWWLLDAIQKPQSYTLGCSRYQAAINALDGELKVLGGGTAAEALKARKSDIEQQRQDDKICRNAAIASTSQTASASPTTSTVATTSSAPSTSGDDVRKPTFYHRDAKTLPFSFGPAVTQKEAINEWWNRLANDPSLACGDGGLVVQHQILGSDCTRTLMWSRMAHDNFVQAVRSNTASVEVVEVQAVKANTYEMVMVDGIPVIMPVNDVPRPGKYLVLRVHTKDGRSYDFRLECGFQPDQPIQLESSKPISPPPALPMAKPIAPAPPCVNGNGRDSESRCGDTPPDKPKPSTPGTPGTSVPTTGRPTTSTPTTSVPTTGTPTTSVPTTSTPSLEPKKPEVDGGNRGAVNENQGPGEVTTPTQPPATVAPTSAPQVSVNPGDPDGPF